DDDRQARVVEDLDAATAVGADVELDLGEADVAAHDRIDRLVDRFLDREVERDVAAVANALLLAHRQDAALDRLARRRGLLDVETDEALAGGREQRGR